MHAWILHVLSVRLTRELCLSMYSTKILLSNNHAHESVNVIIYHYLSYERDCF